MSNLLYDHLFKSNAGRADTFLSLENGDSISYTNFLTISAQFAHLLSQQGLNAGDRLAAQVEKSPQALALYAACIQSGVVFLPLNTAYTADELAYFIDNSGASMIICDSGKQQAIRAIAPSVLIETLDKHGQGSLTTKAHPMPDTFPTVARNSNDLAALLYTSGTTGRSKGAMLTHGNLLSNAKTLVEYWRFTSDDVLLHALPIFHTHGLFVASNVALLAGCSMIFLPTFDLDAILTLMPRATTMMGVPTFYTRLLDTPDFNRDMASHMRLFISGSAPLLADTHRQFEERIGHRILERYGMTETNMNTSNPYQGERRAGTVGFPLPGIEIRITDTTTQTPLANGEVGLIEVRGPNVFTGYWQMADKTATELRDNGFFMTGDLGKIDKDGYLHIVGRDKDLIISGGFNIYPKEIEELLDKQEGVKESAVIGVPHTDFGETVLALIVPDYNQTPNLDAIAAACSQSLARFKHPRKLLLIDDLPRNTMGKVQKKALRERYATTFTSNPN